MAKIGEVFHDEYGSAYTYVSEFVTERTRSKDLTVTEMEKKYRERLIKLSPEEIIEEFEEYAGGDDYDGMFTDRGKVLWDALKDEVLSRLVKKL